MKKFGFSAILMLMAVSAGAADLVLNDPVDLATVSPATTISRVIFNSHSATDPFTLSVDKDWTKYVTGVTGGDVLLDFSNGHHTLRVYNFIIGTPNGGISTTTNVIFRGGSMDLVSASTGRDFRFYYGDSGYNGRGDNRHYLLDGFTVKNADYFWGIYGANNVCVLTNQAYLSANNPVLFMNATSSGTANTTNNLLLISAGSTLLGTSNNFQFDRNAWKSIAERTDNRVVVTGRGSFLGLKASLYSYMIVGQNSPGNSLTFDDHASGQFGNISVGGSTDKASADAKSNELTIDNHSHVTNKQEVYIGRYVGADYNVLNLLNGGELYSGEYNQVSVGERGSYNQLNIVDGKISRCRNITAGIYAGANYNTVRISGKQAFVGGNQYRDRFFGYGQYNEFIFDNCTAGSNTMDACFASFNSDATIGTTNNTLKVVNDALYTVKTLSINANSAENAILAAEGGTLKVEDSLTVEGSENRVICSNGTLLVSTSENNLRLAADNRLVVQGTTSKIAAISGTPAVGLDAGAALEFDAPKEGFGEPAFQGVGIRFNSGTRLVFKDLKVMQGQLMKTTEYQLTDGNGPITIDGYSEDGHEELFANYFANAEGLVTGTSLGMKDVINAQGQSVRALVLQVKSICGGVLLYR